MVKIFLKYCLSFALLLAVIVTGEGEFNATNFLSLENSQSTLLEANGQSDFAKSFFTSTTEEQENNSSQIIFEEEISDDEIKSSKNHLKNRISHVGVFAQFGTIHFQNRVKNILPDYSHYANTSTCWYILYRVFRL